MLKEEIFRIFEDKEIGPIRIIKTSTAKSLRLTVKAINNTQLFIPSFVTFERAIKFIEEKRSWIRKSQLKISKRDKNITIFTEQLNFNTREHQLILGRHSKSTIQTVIRENKIIVLFPQFADMNDPRIQKVIRKSVTAAWRLEAEKLLPGIVNRLAFLYNLSYRKLSIRNNKTRWGSCSKENNISLNVHLIRLPAQLCEYVILHELCHTVHKHHQKSFWILLDQMTSGHARSLDKQLNNYAPEIW
jgi:predicted metal-dependent hydrolase